MSEYLAGMGDLYSHSQCPVCHRNYHAEIGPSSQLRAPDEGDWCFSGGTLYIHEALVWDTSDSADGDSE